MKNVPPVFSKPVKDFEILTGEKWVIWGNGKAKFMNVLSNKYLCDPHCRYSTMSQKMVLRCLALSRFNLKVPFQLRISVLVMSSSRMNSIRLVRSLS